MNAALEEMRKGVITILKAFDEDEYICYGETLRVKKLVGAGLYKERDNAHATYSQDKAFLLLH